MQLDTLNDWEISVQELNKHLQNDDVILVDVRQPEEWDIANVDGGYLVPLNEIPAKIADFTEINKPLIFMCHKGMRSLKAAEFTRLIAEYPQAYSVKGGIEAWSDHIDTSIKKY